ncbi:Uncharacterized protein APZ42_028152 [Daphnia magna]|uniref:Uncharacterized protein n=1 Tax=Daphnia magna TaxID=35525 RepID=A0A164QSD9_9CRUS|nr:Uncharacterized protein APZ42_028152 [Daphnia magna]
MSMASRYSQVVGSASEKMESDDDSVDQILSQMPLLEDKEVVFETIMEEEEDKERRVSEGEMKESMRNVEEEVGKDSLGHEKKSKREQRNTEEEISEASIGDDGSEIERGNVEEGMDKTGDEELENETEKELLAKKRKIDHERKDIEQKLN